MGVFDDGFFIWFIVDVGDVEVFVSWFMCMKFCM